MKKYYCPICKEFKGRLEVEFISTEMSPSWYSCKYCHHEIIQTETIIKKMIDKILSNEDLGVKCCEHCQGKGYE